MGRSLPTLLSSDEVQLEDRNFLILELRLEVNLQVSRSLVPVKPLFEIESKRKRHLCARLRFLWPVRNFFATDFFLAHIKAAAPFDFKRLRTLNKASLSSATMRKYVFPVFPTGGRPFENWSPTRLTKRNETAVI